jgi:hypothetical protein
MMSSLRKETFDIFGCLHEIVQFGVFDDLQSILYSTELDEDFVTVFL